MNLTVLQTKIQKDFSSNLNNIELLILNAPDNGMILLPELALTGYSYENMQEAATFSQEAALRLQELSENKTIIITMITKKNDTFFNTLHVFHHKKLVHTQNKHKIFVLNEEKDHFKAGKQDEIKIIDINGVKIAMLICFELRFIELWQQIQGAHIIMVPAYWGKTRKEAFITLSKALAIANQCFVMCADSSNEECTKSSAIISPGGKVVKDELQEFINKNVDLSEIQKIRNHLNVGIKG
jgi:predicted amidohydrolase